MRVPWRTAGIVLAIVAALQACGSYSAPTSNNQPSSPDSAGDSTGGGTGDSMPRAPGYIHM